MTTDADRDRVIEAVAQPSYTPGRRDLPLVVALIAGEDERAATQATRALLRATPAAALEAVRAALPDAGEAGASRLVAALGQLARGGAVEALDAVIAVLSDETVAGRPRRAAIQALGKVGPDERDRARDALQRHASEDLPVDQKRALVEALGKLGASAAAIAAVGGAEDRETARRAGRAVLMSERDALREVES